jgi:hypothetical protein
LAGSPGIWSAAIHRRFDRTSLLTNPDDNSIHPPNKSGDESPHSKFSKTPLDAFCKLYYKY